MTRVRVLVVEDEFIVAEDMRSSLEEFGYEVDGAKSGHAALERVRSFNPDIILLDIRLGDGIDGISTAESLKKIASIPFIYVTAHSDQITFDRAKATAPDAFIIKPFDSSNLHSAIELALYNFSLRRSNVPKSGRHSTRQGHYVLDDSIFIRVGKGFEKVPVGHIVLAKASGSYTIVYTTDREYTISQNLNKVIEKLNHPDITRIHRTYAVNLRNIRRIDEDSVDVGGHRVPMQKNLRMEILQKFKSL